MASPDRPSFFGRDDNPFGTLFREVSAWLIPAGLSWPRLPSLGRLWRSPRLEAQRPGQAKSWPFVLTRAYPNFTISAPPHSSNFCSRLMHE
jgi:hypothetical protein